MESVLIESLSGRLQKALASNSQAGTYFQPPNDPTNPRATEPTDTNLPGTFTAGHGGMTTPGKIFFMPYAEGAANSKFSFRLWGWRPIEGDANKLVWLSYLLGEVACVTCERPGPLVNPPRYLSPVERLCDTLTVTRGGVMVTSPGPGSGLTAHGYIGLGGCKKFTFDFKYEDVCRMNVFWSYA